jgi:SAM-dependent methyltransferase
MYGFLETQRVMLRDDVRNDAFRRSIAEVVKPGDVVLDVGAGTGLLSLFAAEAGAARVFAVEQTEMASLAERLVAANGLANRVEVLAGDIGGVRLPCQVDVIISEWLGTFGIDENMLAAVLGARDRWLKPDGRMLPRRVQAWMAPVEVDSINRDLERWRDRPYGLDFSLIAESTEHEMLFCSDPIGVEHQLADRAMLWETDSISCTLERARLPFRGRATFRLRRAGRLTGITAWFAADLADGVMLTNAPSAVETHWSRYGRCVFPLSQPVAVDAGVPLTVELTSIPAAPDFCHHAWSFHIAGRGWEHHDTRVVPWLNGHVRHESPTQRD